MKTEIHTIEAQTAGSIELAEHIFGLEPAATSCTGSSSGS